jgi:hypothetical protein
MPLQAFALATNAEVDFHRMAHANHRSIESQRLSQTRPREEWQLKRSQSTDVDHDALGSFSFQTPLPLGRRTRLRCLSSSGMERKRREIGSRHNHTTRRKANQHSKSSTLSFRAITTGCILVSPGSGSNHQLRKAHNARKPKKWHPLRCFWRVVIRIRQETKPTIENRLRENAA